uniref:Sleeping Beauty transposase HTH domain-containing protein n=1 Tax=Oncorhynchus tshawytscha TaxID=74940 RepID=A0AAZ3RYM0_ONCTS
MYFKACLQTLCLFACHHGKIKRNQPRPQKKKTVDHHKSRSSLGTISKRLKVPCSSVQTIVHKYKHHGTMQPYYRSGRRRVLSPRDECTLVRKVQINPRTILKDFCEDVGGNRYKSIYIHSKTSPIST